MKLIIGLGNPGKTYEHTRHNAGFDVIDHLAEALNIDVDKKAFQAEYGYRKLIKYQDEVVVLFKPQTFMNLSGQAVQEIRHFYQLSLDDILVIYDDMDTLPGEIRLRERGSAGGHNGMKDIINKLGSEEIKRIRVGIGKPDYPNTIDYVLTKPRTKEEKENFEIAKIKARDAVLFYLKEGFHKAASQFN